MVPETPNTVTALASGGRPRREAREGSRPPVPSAKQKPYLPGWPMVAMSPEPSTAPPMMRVTSAKALPMQALARLPGPSELVPLFRPSSATAGPHTITATAGVPVVVSRPSRLKSSARQASAAASTTGSSAGTQPAMTQQ